MCNAINHLNDHEKSICSDYVLPSLAFSNSKKNLFGEIIIYQCEGYENIIVKNYDDYSLVFIC